MRTLEQEAQYEYVAGAYAAAVASYHAGGLRVMTEVEKTVFVVWILDAEVNNGGFVQYFSNSSGDTCEEAPRALERIGARRAAVLVRLAVAAFPQGRPSLDDATRRGQLAALPERNESVFERLDQSWYTEIEDLEALLAEYLRRTAN